MAWKRGDLGRFKMESNALPRFEVLQATPDRENIEVWYAGKYEPELIPAKTFQRECVNWWIHDRFTGTPSWVKPGVIVSFPEEAPPVRQAEIRDPKLKMMPLIRVVADEIRNAAITVRSIRNDYFSGLHRDGRLALIPLRVAMEYGYQRKSAYDHILGEDDDEWEEVSND